MTCDLNHSEEQRQILDAAAALLKASFPLSRNGDAQSKNIDSLAEFGAFALALDENLGGTGFSFVEEVLVHVLFGRHCVSTRGVATPLAARIAAEVGEPALARSLAAGELIACAALPAGANMSIIDADGAPVGVVFGDRRLALVDLEDIAGKPVTGLGHGVALTQVPASAARPIAASDSAALLDVADLLVSAQLLGIAEATRDLAVAYAGIRRQFGKPIGAFQAIKHHCADMAIAAEMLSAQIDLAAIAVRDGREDASFQTAAARLLAPRAALGNARICIQVHGGVGFTAEAAPHRYVKQAHVLSRLGSGAPMLEQASPMAPHRR